MTNSNSKSTLTTVLYCTCTVRVPVLCSYCTYYSVLLPVYEYVRRTVVYKQLHYSSCTSTYRYTRILVQVHWYSMHVLHIKYPVQVMYQYSHVPVLSTVQVVYLYCILYTSIVYLYSCTCMVSLTGTCTVHVDLL
jgi:hypothetical protein